MRTMLILAALLVVIPAGTAAASFDGSNGKVAYVDRENGLYIDDPWDEQPALGPLATVGSDDLEDKTQAHAHPPAWSPDGRCSPTRRRCRTPTSATRRCS